MSNKLEAAVGATELAIAITPGSANLSLGVTDERAVSAVAVVGVAAIR